MEQFTVGTGMITQGKLLANLVDADFQQISRKKILYYNVPCAFDIEVSSFYNDGYKQATMYVWMFGIFNWVTYGRTWDEYKNFIKAVSAILGLNSENRLICYIHNFPYEFQFMRKHFNWDKTFFLDPRKPVYGVVDGIEYKCSYKLANASLETVGKDLQKYKVEKAVGDLDYQLVRTWKTPLTEKDLYYCEMDIRVLLSYIQEKIESDGNICNIPLTKTGYVRNFCRNSCNKHYKRYRALMRELTLEPDEYLMLKKLFQGGFTHASAKWVEKIISDVGSFDFGSSYPAQILLKYFPMSKGKRVEQITDSSQLHYYLDNYCCMFDITLHNVIPKVNYDHPISKSKLQDIEKGDIIVEDNGRVVYASKLKITANELDMWVYEQFYEWDDDIQIDNMWIYERGYLPKDFVLAVLKFYEDKTRLKGVSGMEVEYMIAKNMLNACYGMMVTDIVRELVECNPYSSDAKTVYSTEKPDLEEAIQKYNESTKRFLFYPWGVWVTSHARRNLFTGILACGDDYIYSDTDSVKVKNAESHMDYFNAYNEEISDAITRSSEHFNIDRSRYEPKTIKGKAKPIGVWEFEGIYSHFKTLGAKRYLTETDGKWSLTTAGLNKEKACKYLVLKFDNPFNGFADNLIVPPEYSGRLTHTYIDEEQHGIVVDYLGNEAEYHELSSIHMEPSEYEMTISDMYRRFIDYINGYTEVIE